ncbi:hypothetical protein [Rhodococcus sp. AQ5-07]|uniref:hypothetical protein n=1 Tax=Rhodococcus sp. AQ5-07 TaxID=2054902 RepID=UPI000DBFA5CF|nr:hypothetical protein [Rhodococcus sp. AQ5-07]RAL31492.1 hypothetical protein CVN56_27720 [Rhodococcus sp. AQ5-07]
MTTYIESIRAELPHGDERDLLKAAAHRGLKLVAAWLFTVAWLSLVATKLAGCVVGTVVVNVWLNATGGGQLRIAVIRTSLHMSVVASVWSWATS